MKPGYQLWLPPPKGLLDRLMQWLERKEPFKERYTRTTQRQGQSCWTWCPNCGYDMAGHPDTRCIDADLVYYICGTCGHESVWDFDCAPVPVIVRG